MSGDANGMALVARILAHVASESPCTAADLSTALGAARTSTFEAIRRLQAAGLIERDSRGLTTPGAIGAELGFAAVGLGPIAGKAEALVSALRDGTELEAELVVRHAGEEVVLIRRSPAASPAERSEEAETVVEEAAIAARPEARLRVRVRRNASAEDREYARRALHAAAAALSQCFAGEQAAAPMRRDKRVVGDRLPGDPASPSGRRAPSSKAPGGSDEPSGRGSPGA